MRYIFKLTTILVVLCLLHLSNVKADNWNFIPYLEIKESYTDNVRLATDSLRQSDYITEINPGFSLNNRRPNSFFNMAYRYQTLQYQDNSSQDTQYHTANLAFNGDVWEKYITLDALASYNQSVINEQNGVPADNLFITGNRTNTANYQISPLFKWEYDPNTLIAVRPSYGEVKYLDLNNEDSKIYQTLAIVDRQASPGHLGWWTGFQKRRQQIETGDDINLQRYDVGIRVPLTMRTQWFVSGGSEKNLVNDVNIVPEGKAGFWETGFKWQPMPRSTISAAGGKRFFGNTYRLDLSHHTKHTIWNASYNQELQSSSLALQPLQLRGQVEQVQQLPVVQGIQTISNELFLSKTFSASVTWQGSKSVANLSLINDQREYQVTPSTQKTRGGRLNYVWNFSPRTDINFSLDLQKTEYEEIQRQNDSRKFEIRLVSKISRRISGELRYYRTVFNSNQDNLDYSANIYTVGLTGTF